MTRTGFQSGRSRSVYRVWLCGLTGDVVRTDVDAPAGELRREPGILALAADGQPCGAARWRLTEAGVKLERFAVLAEYRNQQAGAALLAAVLHDVQAAHPAAFVYLNAQLPAVRFYERHGFTKAGHLFEEAGIGHYKMSWQG